MIGVQEGNIRKTMAARGLVNGRGPRSGRDLVFRCYPPELLLPPPKKTEADLLGQPPHYLLKYRNDILDTEGDTLSVRLISAKESGVL